MQFGQFTISKLRHMTLHQIEMLYTRYLDLSRHRNLAPAERAAVNTMLADIRRELHRRHRRI